MWRLSLIVGLLVSMSACSNAVFKGKTGGSSSKDAETTVPNTDDSTGKTPTPGTPAAPSSEDPNTKNPVTDPAKDPCEMTSLLSLASLYQLQDDQCRVQDDDGDDGGNDDGDDNNDDDDDDNNDDDPPGNDQPGQNS